MAKVIRDGVESGELRPLDPDELALLLFLSGQALYKQTRYPYQEVLPVLLEVTTLGALREP